MPRPSESSTPAGRERVRRRLRNLTRVAILATAGATAGIGVVVAHDDPGSSSTDKGTSGQSTSGTTTTTIDGSSSSSTGTTGNTGTTSDGDSGNTGGFSTAPSASSSSPTVTSGGTSSR
ncbi:MAG TPA: hypothetical protein VGG09_03615 [Acidimicrobiales bacterium]|jgi:hypothetical protein